MPGTGPRLSPSTKPAGPPDAWPNIDWETADSFAMLTYTSRDSAEAMRTSILGNAENQRCVGIELVSVRVLEVSATATAS